MPDPEFTDNDRFHEVVQIRSDFVDRYIERRVNQREGDFSDEEFEAWFAEAHQSWRRRFPALSSLFPSHLPVAAEQAAS